MMEPAAKDTYCIDILHTWHLGPLADYVVFTLWYLLIVVFMPECSYLDTDQIYHVALLRMRRVLWEYYRQRYHLDPEWKKKGSEVAIS